jgi:hypothetical protein
VPPSPNAPEEPEELDDEELDDDGPPEALDAPELDAPELDPPELDELELAPAEARPPRSGVLLPLHAARTETTRPAAAKPLCIARTLHSSSVVESGETGNCEIAQAGRIRPLVRLQGEYFCEPFTARTRHDMPNQVEAADDLGAPLDAGMVRTRC